MDSAAPGLSDRAVAAGIIVLLGHENDAAGVLGEEALARAELVLRLAETSPDSAVVCTGGFGPGFNMSDEPHGRLLQRHLVDRGLDPGRLAPFTLSARTLEDALLVRVEVVRRSAARVVVVTSDYHAARARYIFGRILPEAEVVVRSCESLASPDTREAEAERLRVQKQEWMDLPLYGAEPWGATFPDAVYENASNEQRTYDKVSYLILSGQFIVFGVPYSVLDKMNPLAGATGLLVAATLVWLLFLLYLRTAGWANANRRMLYLIEAQWGLRGFSYNALHGQPQSRLPASLATMVGWGFVRTMSAIAVLMVLVDVAAAALLVFHQLR